MKLNDKRENKFKDFKRSEISKRVARLSRICQNLEIPILIMVDGFESSGKGYVINDLTRDLNPKYFDVEVFEKSEKYDDKFPTIKRFFEHTPKNGHIKIFARSFYYKLFEDLKIKDDDLEQRISSIKKHEKMLYDSGMILSLIHI